jgi:hypothetical protein
MLRITSLHTESLFLDDWKAFSSMHALIHSKTIMPQLYASLGSVVGMKRSFPITTFCHQTQRELLASGKRSRQKSTPSQIQPCQRQKSKQKPKVLLSPTFGSEHIKSSNEGGPTTVLTSLNDWRMSLKDPCAIKCHFLMESLDDSNNYDNACVLAHTHTHMHL